MSFTFRDAKRADVRLLILLAGGTASGKTESAMRLATGLASGKKFAVLDTENGRALHKADDYTFAHAPIDEPFSPENYAEAVKAADDAGFPVIVIDSGSHEYEGVGGVLDIQAEEFARMGSRESARMASWIEPKRRHKRFVQQLLRARAHVILCLRAEDKIEIVKEGGKTVVRPKVSLTGAEGWIPICEKRLPFEATISLLLTADAPGIPKPIKLERRHADLVPLDRPLSEEVGRLLGVWAAGGTVAEGVAHQAGMPDAKAVDSSVHGPTPGEEFAPPRSAPSATVAQRKKLDVLVGQLRDQRGAITTEQLYGATGREPVAGEDGRPHWGPLRDSLSKAEAGSLIERLERFLANLPVPEPVSDLADSSLFARFAPGADGS